MVWLVLDTSAPVAAVGVVGLDGPGDGVVAEVLLAETRRHAEALPAAVDDVLRQAGIVVGDLDGIGVGVGPGSFIGVRTGIAFAKGLARALDRPLVGLPSLLALALSPPALPPGRGLAVVDARRGERYVAHVVCDDDGVTVDDPRAVADGALADAVAGSAFVVGVAADHAPGRADERSDERSDGRSDERSDERNGEEGRIFRRLGPSARGLAAALRRCERHDVRATLVPAYVRPPDAKLPAIDPARAAPALPAPPTPEGP
jgi:tRNA threonylcarbamoyl adenosine modification protein YeaZ